MRPGERQEGRHDAPSGLPGGPGPAAAPEQPADRIPAASAAPGTADLPEIPEAVRAAARRAPGHWIGMVDPEWTEERTPPEWAVLGEWQSDASGGVGDYRANPAYRPSARVLGWPEPTDPVDAAAQRAATGYGSVDEAIAALAEADVTVVRGAHGGPLTATGQDGAPVVLLFTSPEHAFMSGALRHGRLPARELARSLSGSGTRLLANAGAAAPLLVPADSLLDPEPAPAPESAPGPDSVRTPGAGAESEAEAPAEAASEAAAELTTPTTESADEAATGAASGEDSRDPSGTRATTGTGAADPGAPAPGAVPADADADPWAPFTGRTP